MFWKISYFIQDFWKEKGTFAKVLDVGSRNINGSVKDSIKQAGVGEPLEFVGIDMLPGEGVDVVLNGHDLSKRWPQATFDLVTCCETLEHDVEFWKTIEEMKKVLKPGGYLLVTVPSINFFIHDFPSDYYRFTSEVFKDFIFKDFEDVYVEYYYDKGDPNKDKPNNSVLGYGRKPK